MKTSVSSSQLPSIEDMRKHVKLIEQARLDYIRDVIEAGEYNIPEIQMAKIALYGDTIRSLKEAIEFQRKFDEI